MNRFCKPLVEIYYTQKVQLDMLRAYLKDRRWRMAKLLLKGWEFRLPESPKHIKDFDFDLSDI